MTTQNLGRIIRKYRERLQPEDVGLRPLGRRRTPGLRREELAQLCEVSPTWITWIEQGRPVSASRAMLERLADALRLTDAERHYLFMLSGKLGQDSGSKIHDKPDAILESVKHMEAPAYVLDRQWSALSWNKAAEKLFTEWLVTDTPLTQRNLLRFTFLHPAARSLIDNWAIRAKRLVFEFRADCGQYTDDKTLRTLIEALCASSKEFNAFWQDYGVMEREGGLRMFHHPAMGELGYIQTTFYPATRRDLKLVILLPA